MNTSNNPQAYQPVGMASAFVSLNAFHVGQQALNDVDTHCADIRRAYCGLGSSSASSRTRLVSTYGTCVSADYSSRTG